MSINRQKRWHVAVGGCRLFTANLINALFQYAYYFASLSLPASWAQRYFARTRDICCSVIGAARQCSTLPHFKKSREGRKLVKEADWPALNVTDRFVQSLFKFIWKGASPFRMGGWKQRAKCAIFLLFFWGRFRTVVLSWWSLTELQANQQVRDPLLGCDPPVEKHWSWEYFGYPTLHSCSTAK